MRRNQLKTACAILLFSLMIFGFCATASASESYTPIPGTEMDFVKELVIKSDANIPAAVFHFTVSAGTPIAADPVSGKLAVLAGPVVKTGGAVTAPSVNDIVFKAKETDDVAVAEGSPEEGLKTLSKTGTIDFSGVSFPAPGVYRYLVTEQAAGIAGAESDPPLVRTVDVYVDDRDDGSNTLVIAGYAMYEGSAVGAPAADAEEEIADKSIGFSVAYNCYDLRIGLAVKGNQASRYKYFTVKVELEDAMPGMVYPVDLSDAETSISQDQDISPVKLRSQNVYQASPLSARVMPLAGGAVTQPEELEVDDNGKVTQVYYLRHDQSLKIIGLEPGVSYKVTEDPQDYRMSFGAKGSFEDGYTSLSEKNTGEIVDRDEDLGFTNTRNGTVPTGVTLSIIPGAAVILAATAALALLSRRKKV